MSLLSSHVTGVGWEQDWCLCFLKIKQLHLNSEQFICKFCKFTITRRMLSDKNCKQKFYSFVTGTGHWWSKDWLIVPGILLPHAPGDSFSFFQVFDEGYLFHPNWCFLLPWKSLTTTPITHTRWGIWQRYGESSLQWAHSHTASVSGLRLAEFRCLHTESTDAIPQNNSTVS